MEGIFEKLVTKEMGLLAAGAIAVMYFIGSIPIKGGIAKLRDHNIWKNWAVFLLIVLCVAGAFAPGVNDIPKSQWGSVIIFGCVAALAAHLGRQILKPIILRKLEGKKKS